MVLALGQVVNSAGISLKIGVLRSYSQTHSSSLFGLHLVPTCLYSTCFMRSQWKVKIGCFAKFEQYLTLEAVLCMGGSKIIQVWNVLSEYIEQFSMWGVPNPKIWIVLAEHFKFASTGFI